MCEWCEQGGEYCQGCGKLICMDIQGYGDDVFSGPYVTGSGDLYCHICGPSYEDEDDGYEFDMYASPWVDRSSGLTELEPEETPREAYIGPGSEESVGDIYPTDEDYLVPPNNLPDERPF